MGKVESMVKGTMGHPESSEQRSKFAGVEVNI